MDEPVVIRVIESGERALRVRVKRLEALAGAGQLTRRDGADTGPQDRKRTDARHEPLRLLVGARPPPGAAEPAADRRAPVAPRDLREARDPDRPMLEVLDDEV